MAQEQGAKIRFGDFEASLIGRISWGLMLQLAIIAIAIMGALSPKTAVSILIAIIEKLKNIGYRELAETAILWIRENWERTQRIVRIASLIFLLLIGLAIFLFLQGQTALSALILLAMIFIPWIIAMAINFGALAPIASAISGVMTWILIAILSLMIFPASSGAWGLRLIFMIFFMILSSIGVGSGNKAKGLSTALALILAVCMLAYGSSTWVKSKVALGKSSTAVSAARADRSTMSNRRRAQAITSFTLGLIIQDGTYRKAEGSKTTLAKEGEEVAIWYENGQPIRLSQNSNLSQTFIGTFVKVSPSKNGSFSREEKDAWWIEDYLVRDLMVDIPEIAKKSLGAVQKSSLETKVVIPPFGGITRSHADGPGETTKISPGSWGVIFDKPVKRGESITVISDDQRFSLVWMIIKKEEKYRNPIQGPFIINSRPITIKAKGRCYAQIKNGTTVPRDSEPIVLRLVRNN